MSGMEWDRVGWDGTKWDEKWKKYKTIKYNEFYYEQNKTVMKEDKNNEIKWNMKGIRYKWVVIFGELEREVTWPLTLPFPRARADEARLEQTGLHCSVSVWTLNKHR